MCTPPLFVNLSALDTRLVSICLILVGSVIKSNGVFASILLVNVTFFSLAVRDIRSSTSSITSFNEQGINSRVILPDSALLKSKTSLIIVRRFLLLRWIVFTYLFWCLLRVLLSNALAIPMTPFIGVLIS